MPFPLTLMMNFTIPVLSGQPVLSGHLAIPRGLPLNTGLTVGRYPSCSSNWTVRAITGALNKWLFSLLAKKNLGISCVLI